MNETVAEAIILAINALGAGIVLFIAGVIQQIMNEMDEPASPRVSSPGWWVLPS